MSSAPRFSLPHSPLSLFTPNQSKEDLDVNLQRTNRIPQLKLLQHARMQDAKRPNHPLLLPPNPQIYRRRMPGQERRIIHLSNPIRALALRLAPQPLLARRKGRFKHQHDAIQKPMHDLEAAVLGQKGRGEMALVATFALEGEVLEGDVADLEDLHRDAVVFVFAQGLEEARQEGGADDLVLGRFGVGEADGGGAVVGTVQVGKVLGVRAEDQGEDFGPACHGGFESDNVGEFVDGEGLGDGGGDVGEGSREVVEAVGYCDVFHYIGLMQDVCASGRDVHVYEVVRGGGWRSGIAHSLQQGADFGSGERQAATRVDVRDRGLGLAGSEVGDLAGLMVMRGSDLDGFDREGLRGVLGEHGDEDVVDYLGFGFVCGCYVDENVAGFEADFGVVGVDDWGHGADSSVRVEDHRVDWRVSDNVEIA